MKQRRSEFSFTLDGDFSPRRGLPSTRRSLDEEFSRRRLHEASLILLVHSIPSGDALVMLNFSPDFISEWGEEGPRANISNLADHADYIGKLAGREHVGIGSDYDGIAKTPQGLEDASKYPDLLAELIRRGWSDEEVRGVAGGNLFRVLEKVEKAAHSQRKVKPFTAIFDGRDDMKKRDHF
jgi:membrane dipeptidase